MQHATCCKSGQANLGCRDGRKEALLYPSKSSLTAHDRVIGQWLANQRQELAGSTEIPLERKTLVQSLPGWASFVAQGSPSKKRTEGKDNSINQDSKPHLRGGSGKSKACGDSGETSCQHLGKRLRKKTSIASLRPVVCR